MSLSVGFLYAMCGVLLALVPATPWPLTCGGLAAVCVAAVVGCHRAELREGEKR